MSEPTSSAFEFWPAIRQYILPWLPGALGSAMALKFLGEGIGYFQRLTSFCSGMIVSAYISPAALEYWGVAGEHIPNAINFAVGLFALAIVREVFKGINEGNFLGRLWDRLLDRFIGAAK